MLHRKNLWWISFFAQIVVILQGLGDPSEVTPSDSFIKEQFGGLQQKKRSDIRHTTQYRYQ